MDYQPDYKHVSPATYGSLTGFYDFGCEVLGLGKSFKRRILDSIEIADGSTILDVGCGTGVFLELGKQKHANTKFVRIDPDERALEIAKQRLSQKNLEVELIQGYAEALPLDDNSVDHCFSSLAIHHVPDEHKLKATAEIYRVLKSGGRVVIADFGQSKWLFQYLRLFEKHIKGNLDGMIMKGLKDNSFRDIRILWKKWPGIQVISAKK